MNFGHYLWPETLGIACPAGGCGGKASCTTTGIIAAQQVFAPEAPNDGSLTIIGSDGALGRDLVRHFRVIAPRADLVVCDLAYDSGASAPPDGLVVLPAEPGRFTRDCLGRGGTIIATTVGGELEASDLDVLGSGALLVLAHYLATPQGVKGVKLMRAVAERRVTAIPGQLLTLGGALTSRLEWFSRKSRPGRPFDDARKALAHRVVRAVSSHLAVETLGLARSMEITPYEAMIAISQRSHESSVCA